MTFWRHCHVVERRAREFYAAKIIKLKAFLDEYIKAAGIGEHDKSPLFRSALGRTGLLNGDAMHRIDAYRMIQRRASELGLKVKIGCHTFRATGITAYLEAGGTLENEQLIP